jgi:transglutaminase-like putative cysteine protease
VKDAIVGAVDDWRSAGPPRAAIAVAAVLIAGAVAFVGLRWDLVRTALPHGVVESVAVRSAPLDLGPRAAVPLGVGSSYGGPVITPLETASILPLTYAPPGPTLFRTSAVEALDAGRGAVAPPPAAVALAPAYRCAVGCVAVEIGVHAGPGLLPIPVPTGHRVETSGIRIAGRAVGPLLVTAQGDPVIALTDAETAGRLAYRTGPAAEELPSDRAAILTEVPAAMVFPEDLSRAAAAARAVPSIEGRAASALGYVERFIAYDRSPATVEAYRRFLSAAPAAGWLDFVAASRRGDCDVKNAVAVAVLRRAGVPSRLAVGYAGDGGAAVPGMHAWVEYYDGGWIAADATGAGAGARSGGLAPVEPPTVEPAATLRDPGAAAAPAARQGSGAGKLLSVAIAAAAVAAVAAILSALALAFSGGVRRLSVPKSAADKRRVAAKMLVSSFGDPSVWLKGSGLEGRPLLPVLGNAAPFALDEALAFGEDGALWFSTGRSALARRAADRGARILDAGDPEFGEIAPRIPGAQDLDAISKLYTVSANELPPESAAAGRLIEAADGLLQLGGCPPHTACCCPGLADGWMRDVDLAGLRLRARPDRPTRFVAVSPDHPFVTAIAARAGGAPELGAFLLVDALLGESGLVARHAERLRKIAAKTVLEEAV